MPPKILTRLVLSTSFILLLASQLPAQGDDSAKLIAAVIAGIESNYSQIQSFQATLVATTKRSGAQGSHVAEKQTPGSGATTYTVESTSEFRTRVSVAGDKLRADIFGTGQEPTETVICDAHDCRQYVPGAKKIWIRKEGDMPSIFPYDPRQIGLLETTDRLPTLLAQQQRILGVRTYQDQTSESACIEVTLRDSKDRKLVAVFDAKESFLPKTLSYYTGKDSTLNVTTSIRYKVAQPSSVWFPENATLKILGPASTQPNGAPLEYTNFVVHDLVVNPKIPDNVFVHDLPAGTAISDPYSARRETPNKPPLWTRLRITSVVLSVVLAAALIGLLIYRRRCRRSSLAGSTPGTRQPST